MSASQTRQRGTVVQVRLTPEERAQISAAAQANGLSLSGYARETLLGAPTPRTQRAAPPLEVQTLARLLGQLGKVGGNLNQLVKLAQQRQIVPPSALDACLSDVRSLTDDVRRALK